jgi:asparagine synthase (glutamine-hydrolysing)
MCGIAGFNWDDESLLRDCGASISHRGPDATGFFCRPGRISLAHTRLSIVDLHDRANQPLRYQRAGREYVLVFNGEIYNFRELRRQLCELGCEFHTTSDSEVLVAAYAVWGEDCVRRFNGMWAFAIYDEHAGKLFVSRDRFGKKPLYYWSSDSRFMFASEIKALCNSPVIARVADTERVSDLLNFGLAGHSSATFFRDVRQLPAGCNAIVDVRTGNVRIDQYYVLPRRVHTATSADVREALRAAVERRLISDVPVCLSLSGGVDSSSIAAMIAEGHNDRMVAFTTTSEDSVGDETCNVRRLVDVYPQFELIRVPIGAFDFPGDFERIIYHMDEPFIYDSPFVRWKIAESIHEHGFKVSLTGEGADELMGGYQTASHQFLRDLWHRRNYARLAFELMATLRQPDWRPILSRFASRYVRSNEARLRGHFLENAAALGSRLQPTSAGAAVQSDPETLKDALHAQVSTFFLPYLLTCNDKMYMAHAVESRAPFLDVELAELLLGIATERLIVGGIRKFPLRAAMRGRVPNAVLFDRHKIGFASTIRKQLAAGTARSWVHGLFEDPRSRAFLDSARMLAAYDAIPAGGEVSDFIVHAIALEVWMREFDVVAA